MISSVNGMGGMGGYMAAARSKPPGPDGFRMVDTDASGGVSGSELETFASTIESVTGNTIDVEATMETYDRDGDATLSGEELFRLVTEYGLRPSAPGTSEGDWTAAGEGSAPRLPPPPPPSPTAMALQGLGTGDSGDTEEESTVEMLYAQLMAQMGDSIGSGNELESLLGATS